MSHKILKACSTTTLISLFLSLGACSQNNEPAADPQLARACFETHRASLPPGSQFEGASQSEGKIKVRVMDGVGIRIVECAAADKPNP